MKSIAIGEFKAQFVSVIKELRDGQPIATSTEGLLYCRPLHNTPYTGHSMVSGSRRRSLAVLDSGRLDKHL